DIQVPFFLCRLRRDGERSGITCPQAESPAPRQEALQALGHLSPRQDPPAQLLQLLNNLEKRENRVPAASCYCRSRHRRAFDCLRFTEKRCTKGRSIRAGER